MRRRAVMGVLAAILLAGCKSPFDRTRDASSGGALGNFNTVANLVVFSNELKTGGGAFLYPSGENQSLTFGDTSNPVSARSIRYIWNGQAVGGQIDFAGFTLMHTPSQADYATTNGRNLSTTNYTKVTFYARGTLATNTFVKVEVADDGNSATAAPCVALSPNGDLDALAPATPCGVKAQIGSDWASYSIPVPNANLNPVKDFFKATIIFLGGGSNPGGGGTVYFDQIEYKP
jgi:hypothetical protein